MASSNCVAIDMPDSDRVQKHISAQKVQEGAKEECFTQISVVAIDKPDPCKELKPILEYKVQQGTCITVGAEARPLIQKVPQLMRENENNKNNYVPRLISIGPYHYGDPKLKLGQTLKTKLLQQLSFYLQLNSSGKNRSLDAYFHSGDFDKIAQEARGLYARDSKLDELNNEAFKCLMFLDGCFVVYFIHCIVNKSSNMQMKNDHKAIIIMDLLLLENQLPYKVLQALTTEFKLPDDDVQKFIKKQTEAKGGPRRELKVYECIKKICVCCKNKKKPEDSASTPSSAPPLHLLDFLRTEFLVIKTKDPKQSQDKIEWQSFRSVEELKAAGIHCKTSGSTFVKEIKFKPYGNILYGSLCLPAIVIDDYFKTKWLNMSAYEACIDFINDGDITSFICFMDSLIDRPEDVKELREKGVLQNSLGSDKHVADLFNELATDLIPNPEAYGQVKHDIQKHLNNIWAVWFAEFLHTHFSSPWTVFAFIAALIALYLTAVQAHNAAFT